MNFLLILDVFVRTLKTSIESRNYANGNKHVACLAKFFFLEIFRCFLDKHSLKGSIFTNMLSKSKQIWHELHFVYINCMQKQTLALTRLRKIQVFIRQLATH